VAGVFSKYHAFHSGQGTGMDVNLPVPRKVPLVIDWKGRPHLCVQSSAILTWARVYLCCSRQSNSTTPF
jgi:hypothetical protein